LGGDDRAGDGGMSFGTQHPREYIEDKHGELNRAVNNVLSAALPVRLSPPERAL
jgi:hypothetical protein